LIKIEIISAILILMTKAKKQELIIFLIIVGVAAFFRLYQLAPTFASGLDVSKLPSAIMGILTVIGLYLLTKELFEWRLAAIAAYLTAISFWAVNFSRMDSAVILIPFLLVYSFYFLWRGIKKTQLSYFFIAGIFGGLGFYTNSFCVAPVIAIVLFINYWLYLKKDFSHDKYEYAKTKLLQGFVIFALTTFAVALPAGISFWQNTKEIFSTAPMSSVGGNISATNIVRTLGMFNFASNPLLPWPIGVFFVVGFINEIIHWLRRKHGHFSTTHTLLFVWFFVMLVPGFISATTPDALLTIGALPVVVIFTARGIWWFFDKLSGWYKANDPHSIHEAHAITALVMIVFLFSIGFMEYWRYFK